MGEPPIATIDPTLRLMGRLVVIQPSGDERAEGVPDAVGGAIGITREPVPLFLGRAATSVVMGADVPRPWPESLPPTPATDGAEEPAEEPHRPPTRRHPLLVNGARGVASAITPATPTEVNGAATSTAEVVPAIASP